VISTSPAGGWRSPHRREDGEDAGVADGAVRGGGEGEAGEAGAAGVGPSCELRVASCELLARHHVCQSLSRPRQCWDNAVAESFFATLKTEPVYRQPRTTIPAARTAVFEYVEVFYNRKRPHSALGYRSPSTCEVWRLTQLKTAPAA